MSRPEDNLRLSGSLVGRFGPGETPRIGKLEIVTLLLFVLWRVLVYLVPGSVLAPVGGLAFIAAFGWVAFRWTRRLIQFTIWRLRNRLLLSYVFIAVVPILLLGLLGAVGAWALSGQVAAYLVAQKFESDLESLRVTASATLRSLEKGEDGQPSHLLDFFGSRLPGIQILVTDGSKEVLRYPSDAALKHPPEDDSEFASTVVHEGRLYSAAHVHRGSRQVSFLVPISRRYLQRLVSNLGEVTLIERTPSPEKRMRLHSESPGTDGFVPVQAVAPAVNSFDFEVNWATDVDVVLWENPKQVEKAWLGVITRISQVFRVIFSQKADWDQPGLIAAFYAAAFTFLLVELVALAIGISITRTMTSAVHYLYESTEKVQAGDFSYRIPIKGHDQLSDLGRRYNQMIENLERLLKVAKENERLQADLDIAIAVQEQLYPRSVPSVEGLQLTARLIPAKSVSGDYYDYQRIDSGTVAFAIGDVAGKGISAAILMANVQSAMRTQLRVFSERNEPVCTATMVSQLNKHLEANTTTEKYATFFFGVYDERTQEIITTNAGHLPPILLRNGEAKRLDVNGMVVGVFPFAQYDASRVKLETGDLLLLFTDGITEPENEYGEMFGEDRLIETVLRVSSKSNEEILNEVFDAVRQWTFAPDSADDMTMLIIRRTA